MTRDEPRYVPVGEVFEVHSAYGSFDSGVRSLNHKNIPIASAAAYAEMCVKGLFPDEFFRRGIWLPENTNYFPNKEVLIASTEHNQVIKYLPPVTDGMALVNRFYLDDKMQAELRERAETDVDKAVKSGVLLMPQKNLYEVPLEALCDQPVFLFLFRKWAKEYVAFLKTVNGKHVHLDFGIPLYPGQREETRPYAELIQVYDFWITGSRTLNFQHENSWMVGFKRHNIKDFKLSDVLKAFEQEKSFVRDGKLWAPIDLKVIR